jgi:hypothetical protein
MNVIHGIRQVKKEVRHMGILLSGYANKSKKDWKIYLSFRAVASLKR